MHTHADGQAQSNMPFNFFKVGGGGHKNCMIRTKVICLKIVNQLDLRVRKFEHESGRSACTFMQSDQPLCYSLFKMYNTRVSQK